jgi:GTPase SAR1 family protein
VFDLTRRQTFEVVQRFLLELRQYAEPDCVGFLVGNKTDLIETNPSSRQVQQSEAKNFAEENKLIYIETSALSSNSVTEAFESLVEGKKLF